MEKQALAPPTSRVTYYLLLKSPKSIYSTFCASLPYKVEPRFKDLRYNDIPGITINIRLPIKSCSKMYGAEPRYNDIPSLTMGMSLSECKKFPVTTIKSISQATAEILI